MYIVESTMKYSTMTYIFIVRTTFSKKVDAMIYTQYCLLSIPVIKTKYYYSLYLGIGSTYYYKITMINETLQNIVIPTTDIFAVQSPKKASILILKTTFFAFPFIMKCLVEYNSKLEIENRHSKTAMPFLKLHFSIMHASFSIGKIQRYLVT